MSIKIEEKKQKVKEWVADNKTLLAWTAGVFAGAAVYVITDKIGWKIDCMRDPSKKSVDNLYKYVKANPNYKYYTQHATKDTIANLGKVGETMLESAKNFPNLDVDSSSEVLGLIAFVK